MTGRTQPYHHPGKRLFDVLFSILAIACTLPLYPLIMLAIWLEDGRPFFFSHKRETIGGREFGCLKFRTMRRDAEQIKEKLQAQNQVDGPQFFIRNDPRLTRVGRILRARNLDELGLQRLMRLPELPVVNRINRFRGILNRSAVERDRGNGHQAGWRQQRGESATQ